MKTAALWYEPVSPEQLRQAVADLGMKLEEVKTEIRSKEEWFDRFQRLLDKVGEELRSESDNRMQGENQFRDTLADIQRRTAFTAALISMIAAIIITVAGGLILNYVVK